METEELSTGKVHHGRNIRRTRIEKNIKQDVLSELVHLSQPAISKYEKTRVIDDEMLHRFARALEVPFEYLKTLQEDAPSLIFENNTVNNNDNASGNVQYAQDNENVSTNNIHPIEKCAELYERLLNEKEEKYISLEQRLNSLEKNLQSHLEILQQLLQK